MKKSLVLLGGILCLTGLLSSCHRNRSEFWEDTKTCKRYMGKGIRSLFGEHKDARQYALYDKDWNKGSAESDYVPIAGAEEFEQLGLQDYAPISKESPGDPDSPIPGVEGFREPNGKLAALFSNIHFDTDNYSVKGSENVATLREIAHYLMGHPNTYVFVEGHADERGAAAYNFALGSKRANSVRAFLVQNGVNPDQLFTISYGLERPFASGHDENAWLQNRRSQFRLYDR